MRVEVDSSAVVAVDYAARLRCLDVEYHGGGRYRYHGVPRHVYERLLRAESIGAFVNREVKPRYPYTRLAPVQRPRAR